MARAKKRKDGYFRTDFTYEGKRYTVYAKTAAELAEKKVRKLGELKAGTAERLNPTMEAYYEAFTDRRRDKVTGATIRVQVSHFNRVKDIPVNKNGLTFGKMRIQDVTPTDMLTVQKALAEKYTSRTVNDTLHHISQVFNTAVIEEVITKSPCRILEPVKRTERPAAETIHRALSHEEARKFFEAAKDSFYCNTFKFLLQTGLRIGELAVLNEISIDERNKMLHVRATQTRGENHSYEIGQTTKTAKGIRDVPLTEEALHTLEAQRELKRMVFGNSVVPFLFCSSRGKMLEEPVINLNISKICKAAGIEKITAHSFRATFATWFVEQNPENYKALSEILGHSDISITLNLYTKILQERKITAMNAVHFLAI